MNCAHSVLASDTPCGDFMELFALPYQIKKTHHVLWNQTVVKKKCTE